MSIRTREEWAAENVFISEEVDLALIADDATLFPGCRIRGAQSAIGPGSVLGEEAPVTLEDCQLGRGVKLKGGYFSGSVFFDGANMGSGAHVRAGTILEEEANGAHSVGLKQTVLFPFVTLGSLINFCDILMAGGTSRKDHSEVGSSYIHFNYTPHQDKATASLVGDVVKGVFLDQQPIFLGGQGGLVGPARLAYGSVVAAGGICRSDILKEQQLHIPKTPKTRTVDYKTGVYSNAPRVVKNNLLYIGNILALREWYKTVRAPRMNRDEFDRACLTGGLRNLDLILAERIKRLGDLADKMKYSVEWLKRNTASSSAIEGQLRFVECWPEIEAELREPVLKQDEVTRQRFLDALGDMPEQASDYIEAVHLMHADLRTMGEAWLASIVEQVDNLWAN